MITLILIPTNYEQFCKLEMREYIPLFHSTDNFISCYNNELQVHWVNQFLICISNFTFSSLGAEYFVHSVANDIERTLKAPPRTWCTHLAVLTIYFVNLRDKIYLQQLH